MALKNDQQRALSLNLQALTEAHDSGDLETIYSSRINIAENYLQMSHFEKAKKEIEAVWHEIRYKHEVYAIWRVKTRARLALARLYMATGDYPAASRHARGAQKTAVKTGATKHQALALHIRSKIISRTNPKKSSLLMKQSLHLATQIKTPWLFE
jgi:Tfp pilus assembly protein PilF